MRNNDEIRDTVRHNLIKLRKESGLTQTELGEIIGRQKNSVASWEQGLSLPDITTLCNLAEYYNKTVGQLCGVEK